MKREGERTVAKRQMKDLAAIESTRLQLQKKLDTEKSQAERNRLGQFATPPALAQEILQYAKSLTAKPRKVAFLDPAVGTGSFYSAFCKAYPITRRGRALGF